MHYYYHKLIFVLENNLYISLKNEHSEILREDPWQNYWIVESLDYLLADAQYQHIMSSQEYSKCKI